MKAFGTIEELYKAVQAGQIDESELTVVLDNDSTSFYTGPFTDADGNELDNSIDVAEANGKMDIEELYRLIFPKARVEWC
jgi:hypothetical protein